MAKKGDKYPAQKMEPSTKLNESKPAEALDNILSYNAGAFSSDTVFQEQARKDLVKEIEKVSKPSKGD